MRLVNRPFEPPMPDRIKYHVRRRTDGYYDLDVQTYKVEAARNPVQHDIYTALTGAELRDTICAVVGYQLGLPDDWG